MLYENAAQKEVGVSDIKTILYFTCFSGLQVSTILYDLHVF